MFRNLFNNLGENITSSMNEFGQNMDNIFNQSYSSQSQNNKKVKFKEHVLFNTDIIHQNSCSICFDDFREGGSLVYYHVVIYFIKNVFLHGLKNKIVVLIVGLILINNIIFYLKKK